MSLKEGVSFFRHGRACPGHPRLYCRRAVKAWMPGTSSAKTRFALLPGHDELCGRISHEFEPSSRDDFLPLLAEPFNTERDHVAGVEELRRLHAGADGRRGAGGDD